MMHPKKKPSFLSELLIEIEKKKERSSTTKQLLEAQSQQLSCR